MKRSRYFWKAATIGSLALMLTFPILSAGESFSYANNNGVIKKEKNEKHTKAGNGDWLSGDFHQHTFYTDGGTTFDFVMEKDNYYGLDWWANSEHGGERVQNGNNKLWDEVLLPAQIQGVIKSSGGHRLMYRWQSLRDYVYPDILRTRLLYPDRKIASGVEWNVPGHEHCSVGVVSQYFGPLAVSAFEYQFDKSDSDTSRTGEWTPFGTLVKKNGAGKTNGIDRHADAVAACQWMQDQLNSGMVDNAWIVFAHIERAGVFKTGSSDGGYDINHFRDLNNAGPEVCFGFEGAPGHQQNPSGRGGFGSGAVGGGTYGGVGYYTAKVGGLWDALLGEGRHWFNYASSDYHLHWTAGGDDFYPGEYQKNWTYVVDQDKDGDFSLSEIAEGLRSGNSFHVMGDLVTALEFTATSRLRQASMGEDLNLTDWPWLNEPLVLTIKFKSPETNNCQVIGDMTSCAKPVVDHIDLIAGDITGLIDPSSPDYTKATNESTKVIATFTAKDWRKDRDGYNVINYRIKDMDKNMYFRLRGTNMPPNTPGQTDAYGNPLLDTAGTVHGAQEAWNDLWFYSNPIFVYLHQPR
jgi:hypothetical protein